MSKTPKSSEQSNSQEKSTANSIFNHSNFLSLFLLFLKAVGLTFLFLLLFFLLSLGLAGWWGWRQLSTFTSVAGITPTALFETVQQGLMTNPKHLNNTTIFLILGVDSLPTRTTSAPLTDTMILASINTTKNTVTTLALPRDLWSPEYQTRINALYAYGQQRDPVNPSAFPTQVVSELTALPVHYTVVLSLEQLATLIDLLGGIEMVVPQAFVDHRFPRSDVDVSVVTDPDLLYETVTFEVGLQSMDGQRALQYIRSRYSQDDQGTDGARSARQQQVIQALLSRIVSPQTVSNPTTLGKLYAFYSDQFAAQLPITEMIGLTRQLLANDAMLNFTSRQLTKYPETPSAALYHPPVNQYQGQWVYAIRDLKQFQTEVRSLLTPAAEELPTTTTQP